MMQRLRISFSRDEEVKFLSHLDLMRLWERAFRRAEIPLAYSEGYNPHPHLSLAAPLSIGMTSQAELMDVFLSHWLSPQAFISQVDQQLPAGISVTKIWIASLEEPSLQSKVRFAEYEVTLAVEKTQQEIEAAIQSLLAARELQWQHIRDKMARNYDLRSLIDDLWFISTDNSICTLGMRLRTGSNGTGRPEQVTKALGFSQNPTSIHRTRLLLN